MQICLYKVLTIAFSAQVLLRPIRGSYLYHIYFLKDVDRQCYHTQMLVRLVKCTDKVSLLRYLQAASYNFSGFSRGPP